MTAQRAAYVALGAVAALLAYEALRVSIANATRKQVPVFVRSKMPRTPAFQILAPLLGTEAVSETTGELARAIVLDSLPTVIGPRAPL